MENFDILNRDPYVHLCNNSIVKNSGNFAQAAKEIDSDGNMWSLARFQRHLAEDLGQINVLERRIMPKLKQIVIDSLRTAQGCVKERKESCQIFGYDFVVDDCFDVWLLEINSSPTMEPSTALTARLCKQFQEDIVKVVVDLPAEQGRRHKAGQPKIKIASCGRETTKIGRAHV